MLIESVMQKQSLFDAQEISDDAFVEEFSEVG